MLHERSNRSINKYHVTDLSPMISPRKSFLANLATTPDQVFTDRHYDRDWAHIGRVVDGAAWDLGPLLENLRPEVLGARIRATRWP